MLSQVIGYNRLASYYDFLVRLFFGTKLAKAQFHFISKIKSGKVLIIGGGTGNILLECLKYYPNSQYYYIDIASRMVALTMQKVKKKYPKSAINYVVGSIEDIEIDLKFDSVILPFVLDSMSAKELGVLFYRVDKMCEKGSQILFTDFCYSDRNWFWKVYSIVLITGLYLFFNLVCGLKRYKLPAYESYFRKMKLVEEKSFLKGTIISQVYAH